MSLKVMIITNQLRASQQINSNNTKWFMEEYHVDLTVKVPLGCWHRD